MSENWLCLQTYAGQEQKLADALNQLHIPAYTPLYQREVMRFFTKVTTDFALFRTYLFALPEYHVRKSAIQLLPTKMKSYVVGELSDDYIQEMKSREKEGYIILDKSQKKATIDRPYKKGDTVIYSGIGHFEAIFDSYTSDDQRVVILATMFNQTKRMPVSINELALAV